eukprot:Colp12_sorted_trinity150504_noHs@2584
MRSNLKSMEFTASPYTPAPSTQATSMSPEPTGNTDSAHEPPISNHAVSRVTDTEQHAADSQAQTADSSTLSTDIATLDLSAEPADFSEVATAVLEDPVAEKMAQTSGKYRALAHKVYATAKGLVDSVAGAKKD